MRTRTHISDLDPMLGRVIHDFRIEEKLASGGMGAIYLARHVFLRSTLKVIKVLLPVYAENPVVRQRFHREAEAASKLKHECILGIDNFGTLDDGQLFIMVPYLDGQPLDAYLCSRGGRLAPHRALHLVVQLCDALDHAHSLGIIHRDLKPGNVFLVATNANPYALKLLDFGIAKFLGEQTAGPTTHSGMALGTPSYMAVEQFEHADEATHLADIYSLAIMIWEMGTGRLPWQHPDPAVIYHLQRTVVPERPPESELPPQWAEVLLAALSVDPAARPQSARELAISLASVLPAVGLVPSGGEILAGLAPHFVRKAAPGDATVRNASEVNRLGPLLWPQRETAADAPRELPRPHVHTASSAEEAPASPHATVEMLPTTLSAATGIMTRLGERRFPLWKLALAALGTAALATLTTAGIVAWVSSDDALSPAPASAPIAAPPLRVDEASTAAKARAPTTPPDVISAVPAASDELRAATSARAHPSSGARKPPVAGGTIDTGAATQPAPVAPARIVVGELAVFVEPWAMVYVNGRSVGQTPYRAKLPAGSYSVRMKNEDADKDETVIVTVSAGTPATIRRTW